MSDAPRADGSENHPALLLVLAWTFVGIPLAWGIYETVVKSLPLFSGK